ncbi:MAG: transposase [Chitinophagales bacterium]|nr:transposase [Chitinophagales bacterium]
MYENLLFQLGPSLLEKRFNGTDVGKIYLSIPFEKLAALVPAPRSSLSGLGRKPWLDAKGGIALQYLKHYLQLSDAKLIERINTDWSLQYFCGIQLKPGEVIGDKDLPSQWRSFLGQHLDIDKWQKVFATRWKPCMQQTQSGSQDATCYESRIAYPTDVKLLWQGCNTVHQLMQQIRRKHHQRRSRNNYADRSNDFLSYQKSRKKTRRWEKKLRQRLVKYLRRLLELLGELCEKYRVIFSGSKSKRLKTIHRLYEQQFKKLHGEKIEDRIVSISKSYIRPIIRGKEVKQVEFGAKVNKLQIDGISFIEHLSYDVFNEGTRLQQGIRMHQDLFGKCKQVSADAIYATNANRTYCKSKGIVTNFIPKGKQRRHTSNKQHSCAHCSTVSAVPNWKVASATKKITTCLIRSMPVHRILKPVGSSSAFILPMPSRWLNALKPPGKIMRHHNARCD